MANLLNRMPESEKPMSQVSNSKTSATLTTALDSGKKTIINTRRPKEICSDRKASGKVVGEIDALEEL